MRDKKDIPFQLLSNIKNEYPQNEYPQKLWIGLYDNNILCEDCEKFFKNMMTMLAKFYCQISIIIAIIF